MKRQIVILLLVFVAAGGWHQALARQSGLQITSPEDGYAVTLPAGWVQIPAAELQSRQKKIQEMTENSKRQEVTFDGAYQKGEGEWFTYPYILVRVYDKGRIPEPKIDEANRGIVEQLVSGAASGPMITGTKLVSKSYDPALHLFTAELQFTLQPQGRLSALHAVRYTDKGLIQFTLYGHGEEWEKQAATFRNAMAGMHLDSQTAYQASFMDKIPLLATLRWKDLGPVLAVSFGIGIVLAVGGMLFIRRRSH